MAFPPQAFRRPGLRRLPAWLRGASVGRGILPRRLLHTLSRRLGDSRASGQHRHLCRRAGSALASAEGPVAARSPGPVFRAVTPPDAALKSAVVLAGPTASGKSEVAVLLAEQLGAEIV